MTEQSYLTPFSNQWVYVTFRLQLILGSSQVHLTSLRKRVSSFPEQFQSHIKIQTAVDLTDMDLPSVTSIRESLRKDLVLKAGRISVNLQSADNKTYRILLLKTAFSQALPCMKEMGLSVEDFLVGQSQFDAVYMSARQEELSVFSHQYMMRDPRQYQWEYDAEFRFAQKGEWQPQKVNCANCRITQAKSFCIEDQQAYCENCFGDLHRSQRKGKHRKQPISPYNCPARCQKGFHHNQPLTHYCFMCKQLKCSHCLEDGDHKAGSGSHQSMESRQFSTLFRETLHQKITQAKNKVTTTIREIQGKIQLISGHYQIRVKEFAKAFEERVGGLRQWVSQQLNIAAGLHAELKRKYDQSLWLQTMSGELQGVTDAQTGMQIKEGINVYLSECFSRDYFIRVDKRVNELKIFS